MKEVNTESKLLELENEVGEKLEINSLWTNSKPGVSFPAQTIALDLSEYDAIFINAYRQAESANVSTVFVPIGENGQFCVTGIGASAYRAFSVTSSGITFKDCYLDTEVLNNQYAVPFHDMGIKM